MSLALANLVREVLSQPEVAKIDFALGGMMITPSAYRMVKEKINRGDIDVVHDPILDQKAKEHNVNDAVAKYTFKENKMSLCHHFLNREWDAGLQALIIHECTHAAVDLSALTVQVGVDEAAAHVAQMLYLYIRIEDYKKKGKLRANQTLPISNSIHREAWKVAALARRKKMLSDKDIKKLLREIYLNGYKKIYSDLRRYDG